MCANAVLHGKRAKEKHRSNVSKRVKNLSRKELVPQREREFSTTTDFNAIIVKHPSLETHSSPSRGDETFP